jgi:AcrR family transcriptional regulator
MVVLGDAMRALRSLRPGLPTNLTGVNVDSHKIPVSLLILLHQQIVKISDYGQVMHGTAPSRKVSQRPTTGARGAVTRARIREAANQLFLEHGFEATTVDAIVAAAGVSKGTFYLYFERKEDLLLEYGSKRLALVREMLPELLARPTFAAALREIMETVVRGKSWDRELTARAIDEMGTSAERLEAAPYKLLRPLLEMGQARGQVRDDMPAEALAQFVLRSVLGALRDWGRGRDDLSRDTALDYAVTLVIDAVAKRPSMRPPRR